MVIAATGFFDGVHLGHRAIMEKLSSIAKKEGKRSAVITFWPHPRNVLQQDAFALRLLTTLDEKRELIFSMGIDDFIVVPFSKDFSRLTTEEFMSQYLIQKYNVSSLVIGHDHKLGRNVNQTRDDIVRISNSMGIEPITVDEIVVGEQIVSSTKIRNFISNGEIDEASTLLGYQYSLSGVVVLGNQLGRTWGYPTANMQLYEPLKLIPGNGVYCVDVEVLGEKYKGICNIGNRPTIGEGNARTIETHILDFDEDIYGLDMKIIFTKRIRGEKRFDSTDQLRNQIANDEIFARNR